MWVLYGADEEAVRTRRAALLAEAGGDAEDLDVEEDRGAALLAAVECPSLFGGVRVVSADNIEALDDQHRERIAQAAAASDAYVVARAKMLTPATAKRLAVFATVEKFEAPKGASVRSRVREIATRHGLTLRADVERLLVERAGHDLDRVASVCTQLELAAIATPSVRQVETLLGSCSPPGVPWAVSDALERGDVAAAIKAAESLSGIAVLAFLTGQVEQAARCIESGATTPAAAQSALGLSPFVAKRAVSWANALGAAGVREALVVLAHADLAAKRGTGDQNAATVAIAAIGSLRR